MLSSKMMEEGSAVLLRRFVSRMSMHVCGARCPGALERIGQCYWWDPGPGLEGSDDVLKA